ncbi:MAG: hypothetical protein JW820_17550 [Spirochaetales bacterium]|nr:hypothetical protein [Spirochaetales bacterium]
MNRADRDALLTEVLNALVEKCPRLRESCYWAGASAISLEELHHRGSFDLDFHTRRALVDVRPILAEIQQAFPGGFELISGPDEFGSGFKGVLRLEGLEGVTVEVLSNFEDVPPGQLVQSRAASKIKRVTLERFLEDKIQWVAERAEARDLVDIMAVLRSRPELQPGARRFVETQDALILAERLGGWSEAAIRADLAAYHDVDPRGAFEARELLLSWLREQGGA